MKQLKQATTIGLALVCSAIALAGCAASHPNRLETAQVAAEHNGGDLPESGSYLNDQNEELSVSIKTLQSQIYSQNQDLARIQGEIEQEKIKNQHLVDEQNILRARAGIKQRRDTATIRGWKPSGDPIVEHTVVEEQ